MKHPLILGIGAGAVSNIISGGNPFMSVQHFVIFALCLSLAITIGIILDNRK